MADRVHILVVDDEPPLLRLMQAFLERLGYQVESCSNATDAAEQFKAKPGLFRLVVADLTLPDTSGDQMVISMLKQDPAARALLCSGYPVELERLPEDIRPRVGFLQKPFLPNMLAKIVEELLNR